MALALAVMDACMSATFLVIEGGLEIVVVTDVAGMRGNRRGREWWWAGRSGDGWWVGRWRGGGGRRGSTRP